MVLSSFVFSSIRRHTRCALVTGVQTCALPIYRDREVRVDLDRQLFHGLIEAKHLGQKETVILDGRHIVEHVSSPKSTSPRYTKRVLQSKTACPATNSWQRREIGRESCRERV